MMLALACLSSAGMAAAKPISSMPIPNAPMLGPTPTARCVKWDYVLHPTKLTATSTPEPGRWVRYPMDGYPTSVAQPLNREHWRTALPTKEKPEALTVDYLQPVAVTRFVHYFENTRKPTAWKDVDIESSVDGTSWTKIASFADLAPDYPQVFAIDRPSPAQFYRFVVRSLHADAPVIATYELETYYGATVGSVECLRPIQSEPCKVSVRITSPDTTLSGATLKLIAPKGSFQGKAEAAVPKVAKGAGSTATFSLTPLVDGPIPVIIELHANGFLIDKRPYTIRVEPKLVLTPAGSDQTGGASVAWKGTLINAGTSTAKAVTVSWLGKSVVLGDMAPRQSAAVEITSTAKPGWSEGKVVAKDAALAKTVLRAPVIRPTADAPASAGLAFNRTQDRLKYSAGRVTGSLRLFESGAPRDLAPVGPTRLAARLSQAVLVVDMAKSKNTGDASLRCKVIPDQPNPMVAPWADMELRLAVDNPKVMFRPHLDWYTVEHGPNTTQLGNGHNSATRMLCIQTKDSTLSLVPDTDNMTWGFTDKNEMTIQFQIPLEAHDPLGLGTWRALDESPTQFDLLLPVRKGDWWEAYRYVVYDIFKFEQPKQWAMPVTQMQMHNARYLLRYEAWSERCQTIRSFPSNDTVYFNFYGTTYTIPTLYSWYLVTDNPEAKFKAEKVVDWLLAMQEKDGPSAGAWFSQYYPEGTPPKWTGADQAGNRWIAPHSTGTAAKTLLWYWEASGKTNQRVFDAAKRACDWLISIQKPDGGWPYALDLTGKPVTDLTDAGQIWCTWALWRMYGYTGDAKYKTAAEHSADSFKKTFMSIRRYMGYWEDVSGGAGQVTRSWEGYEPAIACLVFTEMGDRKAVLECAKDAATWTWTRVTSTRQYETCYGETTEQSFCGPSQAQAPMSGVGLMQVFENTGDPIWSDFAGTMKSINFCADPDQGYGMCATTGWCDATAAVNGPPFDNVRPWTSAGNSRGDEYGRGVWVEWQTAQFAWLSLEWLVREANTRAPQYVKIDTDTLRGAVLGDSGRVKMPEERCDVTGIDHYDINWIGFENDYKYALLVMNHKHKTRVAVRPHEAHLGIYCRPPRILVGNSGRYQEITLTRQGAQYLVDIPARSNALLVWDRIK